MKAIDPSSVWRDHRLDWAPVIVYLLIVVAGIAGAILGHTGERLGDATGRVRAEGRDELIVVDDRHVVLGRIRGASLDGDPDALIEDVMRPGPATIRPDTPLETVVATLDPAGVANMLVTDPYGRFVGTVYLEDARSQLAQYDEA